MEPKGAVFPPDLIALMKSVLDDAVSTLPQAQRTSALKAEVASLILLNAAKGERNTEALKAAALAGLVKCSHYSHDFSPERRVV